MNEFVHLHLHTEFSLLDGACRDRRAARPRRRAEDAGGGRDRARQPVLGRHVPRRGAQARHQADPRAARSTSRPGDGTDRSGTPGETANHLVLLAETNEGFHNLIKLVSSGYTDGFYYKPRIDKALLAQHAKGLIGLSSCLKGEVATGHPHRPGAQGASTAAATYRDILGPGQLLPRDAGPGHRRAARRQHGPAADRPRPRACRSCARTTCTTCGRPTSTRTTCCCASARARASATRSACKYHGDQFFLKTADEMAAVFGDYPGGAARTRCAIAERCNVDAAEGRGAPAGLPGAARLHGRLVLRATSCARASPSGCRGCAALEARGELRRPLADYEARLAYEIDMIKPDEVPGLLPDRLGLHPLRARAGHSGRARAADRRPAASSPTACGSPTSIRCTSICTSSAS